MKSKKSVRKVSDDLQHIFTAYLSKAVYRRRKEYIHQIARRQEFEMLLDENYLVDFCDKEGWIEDLPLWVQIESKALLSALQKLNSRERTVLFARALEEKPFRQIAARLGVKDKGAATIYYRALLKLRKRMGAQDR